ncbi:MAG: hypothetical protein MUC86_06405 [Burkholderiaceae bacterium]|jgi:tetratricopeptide (TPR) repeat protein|nr:hypothetical protein [Burkholderiaceae bacterium]
MQEAISRLAEALDIARTARKKGDALRRSGRPQPEVVKAYQSGTDAVGQALGASQSDEQRLPALPRPLAVDAAKLLALLVEACGVLGGLLQRQDRLAESLASYERGAALEVQFGLASTYNRLNAVKQKLMIRDDLTLAALKPEIEPLARSIQDALTKDQSLGDSGWVWADLGDCLALLDRIDESARAYATFVAKAEVKSPERALDVLRQIAARLQARQDPGAQRLHRAIASLQGKLAAC